MRKEKIMTSAYEFIASKEYNERKARAKERAIAFNKRKFLGASELKAQKFCMDADNKKIFDALKEISSWNSFAASLIDQIATRGSLSEKQMIAASAMLMKI